MMIVAGGDPGVSMAINSSHEAFGLHEFNSSHEALGPHGYQLLHEAFGGVGSSPHIEDLNYELSGLVCQVCPEGPVSTCQTSLLL